MGPAENRVIGEFTLGEIPLAQLQTAISNDHKLTLGAVGSDLWHSPGDSPDHFWMITDRGPAGEVRVKDKSRRTFPVPEFTPTLLYVATTGDKIDVVRAVPIVDASGRPVTGLPNLKGYSEKPYTFDGQAKLELNPNGLDPEGFVRTQSGDFWVVEEYGPSIVHLDGNGVVLKRYVPQGWIAYFAALQQGPASVVAPIDKTSLSMVIVLAAVFLGEPLTWKSVVGGGLVVLGAIVVAWR